MTNKDEMTMNSDKNAYFLSLPEITELSVPPKTILLEEGKVADRMYLIRKGCLRLFFNNEGRDITFQFFFEGDFVASFDSLYQRTPSLFSLESHRAGRTVGYEAGRFFQKPRTEARATADI